MKKFFGGIGKYILMLGVVFSVPDRWSVFRSRLFDEFKAIGMDSIPIVSVMSIFMGGVVALQTASNVDSPLLPEYTVGFITRSSMILEFCPTIISLILAGKVGSNVASEIGTMKSSEQIDALEVMGVNSLSFLVLPKIIAAVVFMPVIITFSMGLALVGGWLALVLTDLTSTETYVYGIRYWFQVGDVIYALVKSVIFAFLIVSVASYFGYYTKVGAVDVGKSATRAVVMGSVAVLIANLVLTQLILL